MAYMVNYIEIAPLLRDIIPARHTADYASLIIHITLNKININIINVKVAINLQYNKKASRI